MALIETKNKIEFYYNKSKLVLWMFISLIFVAGGLLMISNPTEFRRYGSEMVSIIGYLGVIFFGLCALAFFRLLFLKRPVLVFDAEGVKQWQLFSVINSLSWLEIESITTHTLQTRGSKQNILQIISKNGRKLQHSPIALDYSAQEICKIIEKFYSGLGLDHDIQFDQ
ncbi:MAG: hypothetical protein OHK0017_11990 [Patescibacteria group bacterium]